MREFRNKKTKFGRKERRGFERRGSGGFRRDDSGRDSQERRMHEVTCDDCGQRCEVPFKPTEGKPVYCDNCFRKNKDSGRDPSSDRSANQLDKINKKLDKIMKALEIE